MPEEFGLTGTHPTGLEVLGRKQHSSTLRPMASGDHLVCHSISVRVFLGNVVPVGKTDLLAFRNDCLIPPPPLRTSILPVLLLDVTKASVY